MNAKRKKAEELVYSFFDALDPSKANTNFYKELFAGMSDEQFLTFVKRKLPFRHQIAPFKDKGEPRCEDITNSYKVLGIPLFEEIYEPYRYEDKDGKAIGTQQCIIAYINLVSMKQMVSKKNSYGSEATQRETKTGRLTGHDKAGLTSDREAEALVMFNMNDTIDYLFHEMADDMEAKQQMLTQINTTGMYSQKEVSRESANQISKNTVSAYLIGSCLYTNMINEEYMTPYTVSEHKKKTEREE